VLSIPQDNMILNGSAEVDRNKDNVPDYWKGKDGAAWTSGDSYEGKYCLELPKGTTGQRPAWITMAEEGSFASKVPYIAVEPNKKYLIRLRLRDSGTVLTATNFNIRIHQRGRDKTTDVGSVDNWQTSPGAAEWTEYSVLYQAASNAYWAMIEVYREGGVGSDGLIFDSVWMFKQISWDTIFDEEYSVATFARRWEGEDHVVNGEAISDSTARLGKCARLLSTTAGTSLEIVRTPTFPTGKWAGEFNWVAMLKVADNTSSTKTIRIGIWNKTAAEWAGEYFIAPNEFKEALAWEAFAVKCKLRADQEYVGVVKREPDDITNIFVDWVGIVSADVPLALTDVQILPEHTTGTVIQDTHTVLTAIGSAPSAVVEADSAGYLLLSLTDTWSTVESLTFPAVDTDLLFVKVDFSGLASGAYFVYCKVVVGTDEYPNADGQLFYVQSSAMRYASFLIIIPRNMNGLSWQIKMRSVGDVSGAYHRQSFARSPHTHTVTTQPSGHPVTTQPSGHTKQETGHKH